MSLPVPSSRLTPLQQRVLELLAEIEPRWTLTGGAALAGFHLGHRATRDLDLFWRESGDLGHQRAEVVHVLRAAGFQVDALHGGHTFQRLRVAGKGETVVLDLVAEPSAALEPALELRVGDAEIRVDTAHEILVNKLTALLGRSELRDLIDVRALLDRGGDLVRALGDAPSRDAGFSPLTFAWVLRGLPVERMAEADALPESETAELLEFRDGLVRRLADLTRPGT